MLTAGIFLAVTAAALVLLQFSSGDRPDRGTVRRRLAKEFEAAQHAPPVNALYKDLGTLDSAVGLPAAGLPPVGRRPDRSLRERAGDLLKQAGLGLSANQLLGGVAGGAALLGAAGGWLAGPVGAVLAGLLGGYLPVLAVQTVRDRRREKLVVQLSTGFDQMSRVLRAGQSIAEALRSVVETSGEPLAGEFAGCLHQIELGIRPEEAFRSLGKGSSVLELRLFVLAMHIHRQTGGNLAEVLDRLAALTRGRVRLRQKINSLTAEGRLQSLTLVVLPPLTFGVMFFLNRDYANQLLAQGRLLAATAGLMGVGVLWTRKIINFQG